jgi:hypothetical protein
LLIWFVICSMIADWRANFVNHKMFFFFVQVCVPWSVFSRADAERRQISTWFIDPEILPCTRLAQEYGLTQPLTGMVTAMGACLSVCDCFCGR